MKRTNRHRRCVDRFSMATSSHESPYAEARCRQRTCLRVPTTYGLAASRLVAVAAAVRAAARAAPKIIGQVALRGGAMTTANVNVGPLMANILVHVAAQRGAVGAADVSASADSARVGGGPVGAGRGRRTRSSVC